MDNKKDYNQAKSRADLENYNENNHRFTSVQALIIALMLGALISALIYLIYGPEFYKEFIGH